MGLQSVTSLITDHEEALPGFMAVSFPEGSMEELMTFSPRIMRWEEGVWLVDLRLCASYWKMESARQGCSSIAMMRRILAALHKNSLAALADTPWQAALLFNYIKGRRLEGLVSLQGPLGQRLFREVPWSVWWATAYQYADHKEQVPAGKKRFNGGRFRSQCAQMQRAMKRLGIKSPWGMNDMPALQVKKRFGMELHELWQWSYSHPDFSEDRKKNLPCSSQPSLFGSGGLETEVGRFPWVCCLSPDKPEVTTHLDHPLSEWGPMEPILKNDLDRLCNLESFKDAERVVSLEWRIVFQDLTHLVIPVLFRHPHSLHQEKTHQRTALLQALYSFENSLRGSPLDKSRWEDLIPLEPVTSWTLTVTERLHLPYKLVSLFQTEGVGGGREEESLLSLENRLPVPLQEYRLKHDPLPEDSYDLSTTETPYDMDEKVLPTIVAQAQRRPLFIYREPTLLKDKESSTLCEFTERTLDKWWRTNRVSAARPIQRDYYRLIDRDQRALWVFRDNTGSTESFYIHGIFA